MESLSDPSRRRFIAGAGLAAGGIVLAGCQGMGRERDEHGEDEGEKVTPGEDLMQEHGVLKRILLIYAEGIRRIGANQDLPPDTIQNSAKLVRSFVEEYHEQQEEQWVFPRLREKGKVVDVVDILLQQHRAGRQITDRITTLATMQGLRDPDMRRELSERMGQFIRMYQVHEAREDTVVFPAFRDLLSKREYDALGEQFGNNEQKHFGGDGFDMAVDQVADIEKTLGIYDLAQFTPRL